MKELDKKYRKNELTPDELLILREKVNSAGDDVIGELIDEAWQEATIDSTDISDEQLDKLKKRIDMEIAPVSHHDNGTRITTIIRRTFFAAAAVLIPLLLITTIYFFRESQSVASQMMVVATAEMEKATITLPDGTVVSLNESSRLAYSPHLFNKKSRNVEFSGEAYFDVHKDAERPFTIDGNTLNVKVTGTKFNLNVRRNAPFAELFLEEGGVELKSNITQNSEKSSSNMVVLKPMQKAIVDQRTGEIKVIDNVNSDEETAWKRSEMVFNNAKLDDVIARIEKTYKVNISKDFNSNDLFSGTLTTSNIMEAIRILEVSYGLKASFEGQSIHLKKR